MIIVRFKPIRVLNSDRIDQIRIESAAGSNPILIYQIRTALDR